MKQWKHYFLVLRPNLLSVYKSASEEKLLKQITPSELTAVAILTDPKGRRPHTFGLYAPSKNYHVQATSERDMHEWVDLVRTEARIDEEEEEEAEPGMLVGTAIGGPVDEPTDGETPRAGSYQPRFDADRLWSSSPEPAETPTAAAAATTKDGIRIPQLRKGSAAEYEYSGNEGASYSDFSDAGMSRSNLASSSPGPALALRTATHENEAAAVAPGTTTSQQKPDTGQTAIGQPQLDGATADIDRERVIWHGWLLGLRSKGGVRQWKRLWAVLRPKNLAFYKSEEVRTHLRCSRPFPPSALCSPGYTDLKFLRSTPRTS